MKRARIPSDQVRGVALDGLFPSLLFSQAHSHPRPGMGLSGMGRVLARYGSRGGSGRARRTLALLAERPWVPRSLNNEPL